VAYISNQQALINIIQEKIQCSKFKHIQMAPSINVTNRLERLLSSALCILYNLDIYFSFEIS